MRVRSVVLTGLIALVAVVPAGAEPYGTADTLPPTVPVGYAITASGLAPAPTSLSFSPDGSTLYVASAAGTVLSYPVVSGLLAGPPSVFLDGLSQPLGVLATEESVFVSANVAGPRTTGIVYRAPVSGGALETVISGLPNGRHNTNGLAIGPDGLLYIANGNSTDSGWEGGAAEIPPYSGSVVRVDPSATGLVPDPAMVVATGFRNIYDLAFVPGTSTLAVPTNGPDGLTYGEITRPEGEDILAMFDVADGRVDHFLFPWCLHDRDNGGLDGFVQDPAGHPTPSGDCTTLPAEAYEGLDPQTTDVARPAALLGMHVSADGLEFDPATGDLFITEFGNFFGETVTGHKVVRARFAEDGSVETVDDFITNILPLDLTFGPDGAMWIADLAGVLWRVAALA